MIIVTRKKRDQCTHTTFTQQLVIALMKIFSFLIKTGHHVVSKKSLRICIEFLIKIKMGIKRKEKYLYLIINQKLTFKEGH